MLNLLKLHFGQDRLYVLIKFKISSIIDTATTIEYVTKTDFKTAMANIDDGFENLESKFDKKLDHFRDDFFAYVREIIDEQRAHYEETHSREIGSLKEHIDHKFAVLQEHPVFSDY